MPQDTRTREQVEHDVRLWLAPVLRISTQAAYELIQQATDDELIAIEDTRGMQPRDRLQLVKSITSKIYERIDANRPEGEPATE